MNRVTFVLGCVGLGACHGGESHKAGGPCEYRAFAADCELAEATSERGDDGKRRIVARYAITNVHWTQPKQEPVLIAPTELMQDWTVDEHDAMEFLGRVQRAHVVNCNGEAIIRGTCTPIEGHVALPAQP